ncbi:hypothetical protein AXF42_Ash021811 [Apostasia shenzhenica]|uniref:Uncharacterized protein n=1 Tax=Apostasia shenzhenica TaxID=1088818 RepID=A0A2H9ZX85_9ASPA|nr:hypothetical protein AXF42_Ash021811 [Apostasia shenzhenica]
MAQEARAKEAELKVGELDSRCRLAERRLRSAMRGLEESACREAELQRLLEESLDQNREGVREEFKAIIKEALESSVNLLGFALLDRGDGEARRPRRSGHGRVH